MYHVHFGVTQALSTNPDLPADAGCQFITDGDSFLCWGEGPQDDGTLHIIAVESERPSRERVSALRAMLAPAVIGFGERLMDYSVTTTAEDWGTLDGEFGDTEIWTPMEGEGALVY